LIILNICEEFHIFVLEIKKGTNICDTWSKYICESDCGISCSCYSKKFRKEGEMKCAE